MEKWPPRAPSDEKAGELFTEVIIKTKEIIAKQDDKTKADERLMHAMDPENSAVRLFQSGEPGSPGEKLIVLVETSVKIRRGVFRLFTQTYDFDDEFLAVTASIAHAAVNDLSKKHALVLAKALVSDFIDLAKDSKDAGVSESQLALLDCARLEEKLQEIYRQIIDRALPVS